MPKKVVQLIPKKSKVLEQLLQVRKELAEIDKILEDHVKNKGDMERIFISTNQQRYD